MLDEQEYAEASRLHGECTKAIKELRQQCDVPLASAGTHERYRPLRERYEQLTGAAGCDENEIMHHRLSGLGNPCRVCGKPLRTPRAKLCAACGSMA
jgi:DNA repair exonuclease SbcCD ATPase subunit